MLEKAGSFPKATTSTATTQPRENTITINLGLRAPLSSTLLLRYSLACCAAGLALTYNNYVVVVFSDAQWLIVIEEGYEINYKALMLPVSLQAPLSSTLFDTATLLCFTIFLD